MAAIFFESDLILDLAKNLVSKKHPSLFANPEIMDTLKSFMVQALAGGDSENF